MTVLNAIIQGVLQGLTEFLPVSSSGHLSLWQYFTGQSESSGFMFSIFLHMGTLLAVFIAFYKTIVSLVLEFCAMIRDLFLVMRGDGKDKSGFKISEFNEKMNPNRRMILLLIVSLIPMIISLFLLDYFEMFATDNDIIFEGGCFLITSILLFMGDNCVSGHKTAEDMKYRNAVAIGTMQALAPFPGVSRSGSTISVGLLAGLDREFAVAFSFIMGIPPILAANLKEFSEAGGQASEIPASIILIGIATSLAVGLLAIWMVKWLVASHSFKVFAWYTLTLGVLTIGIGIFERLTDHMIQNLMISLLSYL